ncbi:MAG: hemolysin III family protein [Bacteroidales bacterium]|nr:hemolysin III family protein [Bacteroidales bacterium]
MTKRISIKTEETVNSSTHLIGLVLSIAATALMIVKASYYGSTISIVSAAIFGASLIVLYSASTLYHSTSNIRLKYKLNKFDHSAIYVLIAGTYTPFSIVLLQGGWGWSIFGVQWGLAIIGTFYKIFWYKPKYRAISAFAYIAMGLMIVIAAKPLAEVISVKCFTWLAIGGASYLIGVFFYLNKKIPLGHGIFHLFIIGGSFAHFWAIYNYVLPNLTL